jgi:hypothetical protein
VVERRFFGELIALENRLSRGYGDGQAQIADLEVRQRRKSWRKLAALHQTNPRRQLSY